ncbi:MAG: HAS-barrel domain-containing protein [Cyanobacteria bacterium P01_A01_bin.114]
MRLPLPQFEPQARHPDHFAEVIETSTTEFLAQCLEPDELSFPVMPPFGSWVKSYDEEAHHQIYGVVYHATTSPIDSVHRARALGMSLDDLREQQPQIFAMLKTEFRVAIVGYRPMRQRRGRGSGGAPGSGAGKWEPTDLCYQHLPPRPPQVHQAVYRCAAEEVVSFTEQLDFLRILLQVNGVPTDSLTAAAIREVYHLRGLDRDWLVQAGRSVSVLLKDDYDRLRLILSQIHS